MLINIVSYAYEDTGIIDIIYELTTDPKKELSVTIIDEGKEFDPLKKEDPNITDLYEDGNFQIENSICVNIIGANEKEIIQLAKNLSMYMSQESSLIIKNPLKIELL